jgi:hypothetical protein
MTRPDLSAEPGQAPRIRADTPPPQRSVTATIGVAAAVVASVGDLVMLYVAGAPRQELALAPPLRGLLVLGGVLGVVALPLYAAGYWAAFRLCSPEGNRLAAPDHTAVPPGRSAAARHATGDVVAALAIFACGTAGAFVGSVIHGLTALRIDADSMVAMAPPDSLTAMATWGPLLLALWTIALLCVVCASLAFVWIVVRGRSPLDRRLAILNPALLTLALGAVGLPVESLRSALTPAAPNLAHIVFFSVVARAASRGA